MTSDVHEIRHGYNLADLHELARAAVKRGPRSAFVSVTECYEVAWAAIAEHLVTAECAPRGYELIGAGMSAISDAIWQGERCHGWDRETRGTRPRFGIYWTDFGAPTPGPEKPIIDRTALWQIWPTLTDGQRNALLALATYGDYQTAADSLGLAYKTFHWHIREARRVFLAAWHEHETPSKVWSADRRRWKDGRPVQRRRLADHVSIKAARRRAAA